MSEFDIWWEKLLIKQEQRKRLKANIRQALENKAQEYRKQLDDCFQGDNLVEKHEEYYTGIIAQFDGKAQLALTDRFYYNCHDLSQLESLVTSARDNINLK